MEAITIPSTQVSRMRAALALVLVFCSVAAPVSAADLTGHWTGHWEDTKSGHTGPLRATFTACDADHYRVTFVGRFWKVIPFRYSVVLNVTGHDGAKVLLTGAQNLPLFGTFHYTAEATADDFTAHFCSRRYQGEFVLQRCCP